LAALALCAADVTVRAIRLRLLVPGGPALSLWRAVTINAYGDAASAITPARLGGDPARFAGCRRAGLDTPRALAGLGVAVLGAGQPGVSMSAVIVGSFTLLFGQLALPTPAGAGAVELGFVGGFAETMSPGALAGLLVAWRVYTLILPGALGGVLLAIAAGKQSTHPRGVAAEAAARPGR